MPPPFYMDSLNDMPIELISRIIWYLKSNTVMVFGSASPDRDKEYKRDVRRNLASCCLVCRRWLSIAQPLLFEQVSIRLFDKDEPVLQRFHLTLTGSHHLARYVCDLGVSLSSGSGHEKVERMIGDCLELTTGLQKLAIGGLSWRFVTDETVRKICRLSNLKSLCLVVRAAKRRPTDCFKPQLLLDLPKTLEVLCLAVVGKDLLSLLPTICAKLRSPTIQAELLESSPGFAENRTHGPGLRALILGIPRDHSGKLLAAFGPSFPSLELLVSTGSQINDSDVAKFLSATPLVKHLGLAGLSQVSFEGLPHLRQLRSLEVELIESQPPNGDSSWRSFFKFISYCDHLDTLTLINHNWFSPMTLPQRDLPQIIDGVIRSTTKGDGISTLTGFHMVHFNRLPIDTLEHLCRSALLLRTLRIAFEPEHTSHAAASAVRNLKNLFWIQIDACGGPHFAARYIGGEPIDFSAFFERISESLEICHQLHNFQHEYEY